MEMKYIEPFVEATVDTFRTALATELKVGQPAVAGKLDFSRDISAIMNLSGDARGVVVLSFPKFVALRAVSRWTGMDMTKIKDLLNEMADAVGELVNIICGTAKRDLSHTDEGLFVSLPTVVIGADHVIWSFRKTAAITVPFESELGPFAMDVRLETA